MGVEVCVCMYVIERICGKRYDERYDERKREEERKTYFKGIGSDFSIVGEETKNCGRLGERVCHLQERISRLAKIEQGKKVLKTTTSLHVEETPLDVVGRPAKV